MATVAWTAACTLNSPRASPSTALHSTCSTSTPSSSTQSTASYLPPGRLHPHRILKLPWWDMLHLHCYEMRHTNSNLLWNSSVMQFNWKHPLPVAFFFVFLCDANKHWKPQVVCRQYLYSPSGQKSLNNFLLAFVTLWHLKRNVLSEFKSVFSFLQFVFSRHKCTIFCKTS